MPDLWKVLEYDMSGVPLNVKDCERCLRLTKIFLEYAGSSPLSIFVYGVTKVPDETMGLLDLLFDAWCRRAGQWAEVALNFPQSYLERNSYQLTKGSLKNLHTIHITELNAADGNRSTYNFLAPCRALRSAELSLSLPRSNGLLPSLPWHQLETLALTLESTGPNVSQLLPLCKNVKKLTISIHGLDLLFPDTTVYTLPKVQHLTIHEASPHNSRLFSTFFRCFTLPNLVSLDVDTSTYIFGDVLKESDFSGLLEFLQRSSSRLTSLTLRGECLSSERVVYLLECLEELTTLHLVESRFRRGSDQTLCTPYVFEHLVAPDIFPGSLLPQLLHLKVTEVTKYLPCKELVAAVLSRCGSTGAGPGVERLQSVEVELYDYMLWADDLPRSLRQLKDLGGGDEGLKVIVR
ncbi:hypothetical protein V5O48_002984 [Marasmius crinis-equi]|uniref:F-box domain-containing protein n=1 Tax=Marasmius crinis-equi TaxID=585013 RepID=A0ABR3FU75_9AGAR